MKKGQGIIVIKRIKKGHSAHHGGAWKVAYADFVTAMMCLFLVLWLVAIMSVKDKQGMGEYFRSYSVFKGEGEGGGGKGISNILTEAKTFTKVEDLEKEVEIIRENHNKERNEAIKKEKIIESMGKNVSASVTEELIKQEKIKKEDIRGLKNQVIVFTTKEGVRIELVEKSENPMFESGKAIMLLAGKDLISAVSFVLKDVSSNISIEGHTDAFSYPSEDYTNWELAADRANAARRELIKNGINPARISKVTSFADSMPFKSDKYLPINRRVSILMQVN